VDGGRAGRSSSLAPGIFMLGTVLQLLLAVASPLLAFTGGMRSDSCAGDCSFGAIGVGSALTIGAPAVIVLVLVLVALVRGRLEPPWLPYAGIVLTCALWWLADVVTSAGLPGGLLAPRG
jgi:hypothetical protein